MSIIRNAGEKIGGLAKSAAKASGELVEVSKLKMDIRSEEHDIYKEMTELGKIVYERYKDGKPVDNIFKIGCDNIVEHEKNIEALNERILQARSYRQCPACGNRLSRSDVFCSECGRRVE